MPVPRIAIVGRPNVGKSSLLNLLARDKVSIVDDTAGTTRDRVSVIIDLAPPGDNDDSPDVITAEITDTGGYGVYTVDGRQIDDAGMDLARLTDDIEFQISEAVAGADVVLFVLDSQGGITAHDQTIARLLRERVLGGGGGGGSGRKGAKLIRHEEAKHAASSAVLDVPRDPPRILVVANKCDGPRWEAHAYETAALGFGEPIPVSARNNYFRRDFLDRLYQELETLPGVVKGQITDDPTKTGVRLAIIGKRNAGKSSFVNALAGQQRMIVSEIAGTTRDAVDVRFELDGKVFTAIDTAGLRRKKSFADRIEWWAFDRAARAVQRADVVLLLIDATLPPSQVDQHLAQMVRKSYKPAVIVVNKWDLVEGRNATAGRHKGKSINPEMYEDYLREELKALPLAPISFVSAKARMNLKPTIRLALEMHEQAGLRVGTGQLNRALRRVLETRGPSSKLGTFAKIFFAAQVRGHPPTFVLVVNKPELFTINYQKFLLNQLRKDLPFKEVPINLVFKKRERKAGAQMHEMDEANTLEETLLRSIEQSGFDGEGGAGGGAGDDRAAAAALAEFGIDTAELAKGDAIDVSKFFDDDAGGEDDATADDAEDARAWDTDEDGGAENEDGDESTGDDRAAVGAPGEGARRAQPKPTPPSRDEEEHAAMADDDNRNESDDSEAKPVLGGTGLPTGAESRPARKSASKPARSSRGKPSRKPGKSTGKKSARPGGKATSKKAAAKTAARPAAKSKAKTSSSKSKSATKAKAAVKSKPASRSKPASKSKPSSKSTQKKVKATPRTR